MVIYCRVFSILLPNLLFMANAKSSDSNVGFTFLAIRYRAANQSPPVVTFLYCLFSSLFKRIKTGWVFPFFFFVLLLCHFVVIFRHFTSTERIGKCKWKITIKEHENIFNNRAHIFSSSKWGAIIVLRNGNKISFLYLSFAILVQNIKGMDIPRTFQQNEKKKIF